MESIWESYIFKVGVAAFLTISVNADLLVMHHKRAVRHDERTGAVLSDSTPPSRVESTDAAVFGPDGHIYAVGNSMGAGSIQRFDGQTGLFLDAFTDDDDTTLQAPMGMAFGPDGDLYVASPYYAFI